MCIYRCEVRACKWVRECVRSAIHRWNAHTQCVYTQCMHASVSMRIWLHRRTDRRCGPAAHTRARAASVRPRVRVCDRAPTHPLRHMRAPSRPAVDRGWLGAQVFNTASAFNADIGSWNTASVSLIYEVCAAFPARAARHRRRDAPGGWSVRRGPLCAEAPPMCARVCARRRVGTRMCGRPRA